MKTVLGCLMCLILTMSQGLAISGGPDFGGGGKVDPVGTYAGVLTFKTRVPIDPPNPTIAQPTGMNSLGLFTFPIPKTGVGSGTALLFEQGQIYMGTIQATGDPQTAKITGIVSASFPYITSFPSGVDSSGHTTFTTQTVIAQASGKVNAKARAATTTGSTRLTGSADLQFALTVNDPFDEIIYAIIGFKQL